MLNGTVYLVGAGPGDPGLLTLEAPRLLKTSDVIFHDDLVSPEILDLIPEHVHVENVGKRCGHARVSQSQIHSLMINAARERWEVVVVGVIHRGEIRMGHSKRRAVASVAALLFRSAPSHEQREQAERVN